MTGEYYPPCHSVSYEGEHNYESGGLSNAKAHVLLQLGNNEYLEALHNKSSWNYQGIWIESCNVRLVPTSP